MVDVGPIEEQIEEVSKQHKLPAETEKRIRALLKNVSTITERQANILQSIINDAIRGIGRNLTAEEIQILTTRNIFETPKAQEKLLDYKDNIGKIFLAGIAFSVVDSKSKLVTLMQDTVVQSSMNYVKQLGERYKVESSDLIRQASQRGMPASDMRVMLQEFYKKKAWEADRIVRTETMRAANVGAYAQAKREGATHYAIDGRAEYCDLCKGIGIHGPYPIDDTSHIPPLHPNCACVPVFYRDEEQAIKDQEYLNKQIAKQRAVLEKEGFTIPEDGTGAQVNKNKPEDRIQN